MGQSVGNRLSPFLTTLQQAALGYADCINSNYLQTKPMTRCVHVKLISGHHQPERRAVFCGAASLGCGLLLTGVLFLTGCHKSSSTAATPTAAETNQVSAVTQTQEPASPPSTVVKTPVVTPSGDPDLHELNRSLLRWVVGNRRPPANFEDFAATANITIPPAPAGKKYVIDKTMHIILVKQ
jgi:hypothetical protein